MRAVRRPGATGGLIGGLAFYDYDPATDSLFDGDGITWHRGPTAP